MADNKTWQASQPFLALVAVSACVRRQTWLTLAPAQAIKPFVNGGMSGIGATFFIQPLDIVKARGGSSEAARTLRSVARPSAQRVLALRQFCAVADSSVRALRRGAGSRLPRPSQLAGGGSVRLRRSRSLAWPQPRGYTAVASRRATSLSAAPGAPATFAQWRGLRSNAGWPVFSRAARPSARAAAAAVGQRPGRGAPAASRHPSVAGGAQSLPTPNCLSPAHCFPPLAPAPRRRFACSWLAAARRSRSPRRSWPRTASSSCTPACPLACCAKQPTPRRAWACSSAPLRRGRRTERA